MTPQEKMEKVKDKLEKAYSMLGETLANFVESLTGNTEQNNQEENMEHEVKSLSDSEIEQVLECCASNDVNACNRCPFWGQCRKGENPIVYIHDFINRLKAEKENILDIALRAEADNYKLKAEIDRLNIELKAMRGAANSYKAENERLKKDKDLLGESSPEQKQNWKESMMRTFLGGRSDG